MSLNNFLGKAKEPEWAEEPDELPEDFDAGLDYRPPARFLIPDRPIITSLDEVTMEIVSGKGIVEVKDLLNKYHYLPRHNLVGRQVYIKVTGDGEPVSVLAFTNPIALSIKARDDWIGWDRDTRFSKINKQVMHEARFLILPHIKVPNLASHILSKSCKMARKEWKRKYGDNAVLVESFVDSRYYTGVSYKAAGFHLLGKTKGYTSMPTGKRTTMWAKKLYGEDAGRAYATLEPIGTKKYLYYLPLHRYWKRELLK